MDLFRNSSLEQIQSVLSAQFTQISTISSIHEHHSQIGNGSPIQKKPRGSANWPEYVEVARSHWNTSSSLLAFLSMKSRQRIPSKERQGESIQRSVISEDQHQQSPRMTSEEWQGIPIPQSIIHCLLGYTYTLSRHHVFSQASALAEHHTAPFQAASTTRLLSAKHPPTCLQDSFQENIT